MSAIDTKKMIYEIEKWLLTAENIIANEEDFQVFFSKYGREFNDDYNELIEVGFLYLLPKAVLVLQGELDKIKSLDQAKNTLLKFLKQVIDLEKPKGEKKKKADEFLTKIKNECDEIILYIRNKKSDIEQIFKELEDISKTPEPEQEKEEPQEDSISNLVDKMNLFQRINAYFVIALYAIIEVYCLSFVSDSLNCCSIDSKHEAFLKLKETPSNPVESLNKGLDIQKQKDLNFKIFREKLVKKLGWEIHQESFNTFKEIRKVPAHQKTILSLNELKEKFPKQHKEAQKQFKQIIKELDNEKLPQMVLEPFLEGIEDLEIALYLREIGNSCLRYLVLNESILQYLISKDKFLEETSKINNERE